MNKKEGKITQYSDISDKWLGSPAPLFINKWAGKYRIPSARLKGYDYSHVGMYFITICTRDRRCVFGNINNEKMILSEMGKIAVKCWLDLPNHYQNCVLDEFVIMPNAFL